eukprot:6210659-Pleurochrysis_carterae.AAC.2
MHVWQRTCWIEVEDAAGAAGSLNTSGTLGTFATSAPSGGLSAYADYMLTYGAASAVVARAGSAEASAAFTREYMRLLIETDAQAGGARSRNFTLIPVSTLTLVATRPCLTDIYQEYSDYYNHQLDRGWKS